MKFSEKINILMKQEGVKKTWLSENLLMRYKDFWQKMKENSFTKQEKKKIKILLNGNSEERNAILKKARLRKNLRDVLKELEKSKI